MSKSFIDSYYGIKNITLNPNSIMSFLAIWRQNGFGTSLHDVTTKSRDSIQ